jgi:hypothetical protein
MLIVPVMVKRLSYVARRGIGSDPIALLRFLSLSPVLVVGLAAWADGFREGCRATMTEAPWRDRSR